MDVMKAEVVLLIGANPVVNHPVAATWIKNAVKRGTKLILAEPRRSELARHATHFLQFKPDTDVALLNAMMHTIVEEGLVAPSFVADRTSGYDELREERRRPQPGGDGAGVRHSGGDDPRGRAPLRDVRRVDDPVGHGHFAARARHRQRAVPDRAVADDRAGRTARHGPPSAARPEQRAGRERCRPHPDDVSGLPARRQRRCARRFEALWGHALDPKAGLTVVEIMDAVHAGKIRGMYIMGENPAMSDPDVATRAAGARRARDAGRAGHLPHRDRVSRRRDPARVGVSRRRPGRSRTPTASCSSGRQALAPPGEARQDLSIIVEMAKRLGLDWRYAHPREVFDEMRKAMPSIAGITWERLEREHAVTYPCEQRGRSGRARRVHRDVPDGDRQGPVRPREGDPRGRAARRRVSVRADHRAAARALAHRQHDAAHGGAGRDRARIPWRRCIRGTSRSSASRPAA